jgi:type IV secretory pathway VirB2 component (pilin)
MPFVLAAIDFEAGITPEEEAQFDGILAPVMKVYNFIKYAATMIGVLVLVFAGISFITAGGEMAKKEQAKNMAFGVVIGLILIWVAPLIVQYVFS